VSLFGRHEDVANARLHFASGCVATLTASRASPAPQRCMQVWAPEGYARVDFARRRLTLVQPSEDLRRHGLDPGRLEPAALARLKDELFGRHLEVLELDRNQGDPLTRELQEFVRCARGEAKPRADGEAALNALTLASRVLDRVRAHAWEGDAQGPVGPLQLPAPRGRLFMPGKGEAAA
jgi:predicted dehydrogenase